MTLAYWCVFLAGIFPYIFTTLAKAGGQDMNNRIPREYLANLTGWRKRANWVQQNSFEAFPFFAAGVIFAILNHASQARLDMLSLAFILSRVIYSACYLLDLAMLRTICWVIGFGLVIALFFI